MAHDPLMHEPARHAGLSTRDLSLLNLGTVSLLGTLIVGPGSGWFTVMSVVCMGSSAAFIVKVLAPRLRRRE
jgi:hypothetical protein